MGCTFLLIEMYQQETSCKKIPGPLGLLLISDGLTAWLSELI